MPNPNFYDCTQEWVILLMNSVDNKGDFEYRALSSTDSGLYYY